jgi:hypothetical protein
MPKLKTRAPRFETVAKAGALTLKRYNRSPMPFMLETPANDGLGGGDSKAAAIASFLRNEADKIEDLRRLASVHEIVGRAGDLDQVGYDEITAAFAKLSNLDSRVANLSAIADMLDGGETDVDSELEESSGSPRIVDRWKRGSETGYVLDLDQADAEGIDHTMMAIHVGTLEAARDLAQGLFAVTSVSLWPAEHHNRMSEPGFVAPAPEIHRRATITPAEVIPARDCDDDTADAVSEAVAMLEEIEAVAPERARELYDEIGRVAEGGE